MTPVDEVDYLMSLNTTITESPVILFLGAGASVPLGKLVMKDFVAKLPEQITSDNEASLLQVLISARGYDLEAIMTDLETFISLDYVSSFDFGGVEATLEDAEKLRSLIRHSIIREYRAVDTDRTVTVYQPLFDTIFARIDLKTQPLPIFTTNYDLAIDTFCRKQFRYDLTDGLYEDSPREFFWDRTQFDMFKIYGSNLQIFTKGKIQEPQHSRHLVLFKLHGSVNWMRKVSEKRIVQSLPMYDVTDSDEYQNTIIYPAGNKVAHVEPYLTAYHYFSRCCEHAKLIIAIGYSFRDYDALTSLLKARQENEALKLLILSPASYDIRQMLDDDEWFLWTESIYGYFGNPESEAKYLPEIDKWFARQLKA